MEKENWITAIDKSFQRILRWIYPGILFFVLLYISNNNAFVEVSKSLGFPEYSIWGILLCSFGIGSVLYLAQQYFISQFIIDLISHYLMKGLKKSKKMSGYISRIESYFKKEAKNQLIRYGTLPEKNAYLEFCWGVYHALLLTGILVLAFEFRYEQELIGDKSLWSLITASVFVFSALFLRAKMLRYRDVLVELLSDGD